MSNYTKTVVMSALEVCRSVVDGYSYDPGDSDLDDEQPINVRMTLGDYRKANKLVWVPK